MAPWILRLHERDRRALFAVVTRRRPGLDRAMGMVTHLGDAAVTISLTLALLLGGHPAARDAGLHAAVALAGSHLVVQLLKRSASRARPALPAGIEALVQAPDRFSFPSGHAASSLSVALGAAMLLGPLAGGVLVSLAMGVGLSRCYLGVHYPGDVLAGWLLALSGMAAAAGVL